jgi:putative serine protease PepD
MRLRKPTAIAVAGLALAGAGAGAGTYAAVAGGETTTTTTTATAPPVSDTAATTSALSIGQIYRTAYKGVVEITASAAGNGATGSGFVYDSAGHIVTNYHVVRGASSITVTVYDGSKHKATLVGHDASSDLAVLKIDVPASKLHPLTLADSSSVQVGDGVVAIGSPFGLSETVTSGIVSALNRTISSVNAYSIAGAIQTDASINPGNSGGPLLNMRGEVIGVNSQIESQSGASDGVGFAISSNTVKSVVSQLLGSGTVDHPYLGISVQDATSRAGAQIASVSSGSPAANAGLEAGDVITAVDGEAITSADDLTGAVAAKKPGDRVNVTYIRSGSTRSAAVTLGTRAS